MEEIRNAGVKEIDLLFIDHLNVSSSLRDTLSSDRIEDTDTRTIEEHRRQHPQDKTPSAIYNAVLEIYRRLRPSEPPTLETAKTFLENLFFNPERYDLSRVGRLKINHRLKLNAPLDTRVLQREDILEAVKYLIELKDGMGEVDDIDHLGNRRVRAVGELLENQYRIGLVRMERAIKERMSLQDAETLMPHDLINPKPVSAVVKEFFGSSQLSQFMDQTNPLSEITHKRRLSALGPGGLTRERAGFEVRDVHPTHYGRICPIETPEGPNIGLIASLSTYAKVDPYGFIVTPYRKVVNGQVTKEIEYLSALQEDESRVIAQANAPRGCQGKVYGRVDPGAYRGRVHAGAAGGDQFDGRLPQPAGQRGRLADPLPGERRRQPGLDGLQHAAPGRTPAAGRISPDRDRDGRGGGQGFGGHGGRQEGRGRGESGFLPDHHPGREDRPEWFPLRGGHLQPDQIPALQPEHLYQPETHRAGRTAGEKGPDHRRRAGHRNGELALGRNILVAFMPWGGYNFEDSILISERVVKDDSFTSVHIEEFEVVARDTKLGEKRSPRIFPTWGMSL